MMASSPRMFLWSEVYQGKMCIKPCLYIPSMKDLCFCRMTGVSARDDSIFAAHSMVTPCNSITFPSHGSSVVFRCFSGDLFPSQWNHCFLHWASFKNTCFLRVFSVPNSLDSLCSGSACRIMLKADYSPGIYFHMCLPMCTSSSIRLTREPWRFVAQHRPALKPCTRVMQWGTSLCCYWPLMSSCYLMTYMGWIGGFNPACNGQVLASWHLAAHANAEGFLSST